MNKEQGEPGKVIHIASSLMTILFSSTTFYYFANDAFQCNPYEQMNLLSGKGKTDRKSPTATA